MADLIKTRQIVADDWHVLRLAEGEVPAKVEVPATPAPATAVEPPPQAAVPAAK